ncbi:MAG: alpha/beta fold hydrolase [Roseomonas sp.]|nr:alpha/beta fold hydrolase [Roseomonas sp.]MCA3393236.1 alpha/beta fold hydrolase [Roseomonas sp.]MCA3406253.1 alpha/beta fold hydrolase [Roseomonas sp.]
MAASGESPIWEKDGRDWPNRDSSQFVEAGGLTWHVQRMGQGPCLLLLHGTAAATHSWRDLAPILAPHFTLIAPDLPGHGFTSSLPQARVSLAGFSEALDALLKKLQLSPDMVLGHSAGAAIALRMALDGSIAPRAIFSLNGALLPLGDEHAAFFTRAARVMVGLPFVSRLCAWRASKQEVAAKLLRDTGSDIGPRGVELYTRLFGYPGHIRAALMMMAQWELRPLLRDLPRLTPSLVLLVGSRDRAVPPMQARRIQAILPSARIVTLEGLGHLAHEEAPQRVADTLIKEWSSVAQHVTGAAA